MYAKMMHKLLHNSIHCSYTEVMDNQTNLVSDVATRPADRDWHDSSALLQHFVDSPVTHLCAIRYSCLAVVFRIAYGRQVTRHKINICRVYQVCEMSYGRMNAQRQRTIAGTELSWDICEKRPVFVTLHGRLFPTLTAAKHWATNRHIAEQFTDVRFLILR